jgi:transcriptional regulator with XRE-family HTH domain
MARAALSWRREDLAIKARISLRTVARFEAGTDVGRLHKELMQEALEAAGIVFVPHGAIYTGGEDESPEP